MSSLGVGESCEFYELQRRGCHDMAVEVAAVRHGPFAYMQYTPLCDTSRDARVEINDDIFNFVERTFSSGKEKKERKKIVSQRRERERERKTKKSFIERK